MQAVDKPRQRLDCPRLVRGCQSARSYATLLVGRAPHTPPLSLRSEVGRLVFLPEWLCAGAFGFPGSSLSLRQVLLAGPCAADDPMAYTWPLLFFLLKGHAI